MRPCSPCGDGDTAMKYHDHSNLRQFPARVGHRSGFVIPLAEYEALAQRYIEENFPPDERLLEKMRLSKFVLWLRQREGVTNGDGIRRD